MKFTKLTLLFIFIQCITYSMHSQDSIKLEIFNFSSNIVGTVNQSGEYDDVFPTENPNYGTRATLEANHHRTYKIFSPSGIIYTLMLSKRDAQLLALQLCARHAKKGFRGWEPENIPAAEPLLLKQNQSPQVIITAEGAVLLKRLFLNI